MGKSFRNSYDVKIFTATALLFSLLYGCSTGRVAKLDKSIEQSSAVTPDLVEKFAVGLADGVAEDAGEVVSDSTDLQAVEKGSKKDLEKSKRESKKKLKLLKQAKITTELQSKGKKPDGFVFPSRRIPGQDPVRVGEKSIYEVTYLGAAAGELEMRVESFKTVMHRKVYHLVGHARTNSIVSSILYRVDDVITSYLDYSGLFSHRYELKRNESKLTRESLELFDHAKGEEYYGFQQNHVKHGYEEGKEVKPITPFAQDSFSALFYLRFLPLEVGKQFVFPVVSEGKSWDAVADVLRREVCETPMGRKDCFVIRPETRYQGVAQQTKRGPSYLWVTDDDRRVIVRVEAKVKIGTVVADLKSFKP